MPNNVYSPCEADLSWVETQRTHIVKRVGFLLGRAPAYSYCKASRILAGSSPSVLLL
jgi:hypothetical protein